MDSLDTIHIATTSLPISQRADIEYVKGFVSPTSMKQTFRILPVELHLETYPNPFNNEIKIEFYLDRPDIIDIKIFDVTGRLTKTILPNQRLNSGSHFYEWDATNNQRKEVSSGIYFLIILRNSELVNSRKIILFK